MSGATQMPVTADAIADHAAAWIERRDREGWSADDQSALDAWLVQSPAHIVAFLRAESAWSRADRLNILQPSPRKTAPTRERWTFAKLFRAAAAIAVVGVLGASALTYYMRPAGDFYATALGGRQNVTLADGTRVELNTGTVLRAQIGEAGERKVWLDKGEAYFDVMHNTVRPFVVTAAGHRIIDLGTKFLIRNQGRELKVSLMEGAARVETNSLLGRARSALMAPGDVVIATADTMSKTKVRAIDLQNSLSWQRGMLVFDNMTLAAAAEEFNRYNRQKLIVADPAAARLTIVGTFRISDVDAFAEVAQDILGLRVQKRGDETVISR